jgi:hypothetical protein
VIRFAITTVAITSLAICATGCLNESSATKTTGEMGESSLAGYYTVEHATRTINEPARDLLPGFGFEVMRVVTMGGNKLAASRLGQLIPLSDLKRAKPSNFRGVRDPDSDLRLAFSLKPLTPVFAEPNASSAVVSRLPKLAVVSLTSRDGPAGYYATANGWIKASDVAVPTPSRPPACVLGNEAWIDVDLKSQTLVLYEGPRPSFVTLISGGVGAQGTAFATPLGLHRIVAKLRAATMDNLEHTNVVKYHYESVPFTQYIGRVALHGVFWHDDFGRPKSHGCINLSLADAAYLFEITQPKVPNDAEASRGDHGTVVQVR